MTTAIAAVGAIALTNLCGIATNAVLGGDEAYSSWNSAYNELFDRDAAADDVWRRICTAQAFDAHRAELRAKMVDCVGGFPKARTPLNAKVTGAAERHGYRVENIIFESRPGVYVTCNLYLPSSGRFTPPYPAAIELCGHGVQGKNSPKYQRVALLAARNGIASLVIDPLCQGERRQCQEESEGTPTFAHLRLGVNALLLGHGLAAFEMWDAIRALDYLDSRPDVRHGGYGAFGNSGGGTQSVMLSALDDRIAVTATSCFLSSLREQAAWRLLADSEQLVFAQLREGLNHAGYALLGGRPVLMLARRDDFIPFTGTRETFRVLSAVAANLGRGGIYEFYDIPGPHGYCERSMRASVDFLSRHLCGRPADFADAGDDMGPAPETAFAAPNGRVMDVPGFKSAYECLQEELAAAQAARPVMRANARAALVRRLADVDETRLGAREVISADTCDGIRATRAIFAAAGGCRLPTVELVPPDARQAPALVVGDGPRAARLSSAQRRLEEGRSVMLADISATGEIGKSKHYFRNPNDDEETAKMLYLLGSSLVGRRAGDIIALARDLKARHGAAPVVVAYGRTAVAAAHAYAAAPDAVADVEVVDPPLSWSESVRTRACFDYAAAVHGGLLHYDWTDLIPNRRAVEESSLSTH